MKWFYEKNDKQHGPVALSELQEMLRNCTLEKNDLVWHDEMSDWTAASRVKELIVDDAATASTSAYGEAPALGLPKTDYGSAPEVFKEDEKIQQKPKFLAVISLIAGILCLPASCYTYIGIVLALVALISGYMFGRRGDGKGMASAGRITGWLGLILAIVVFASQKYLDKHPELLEKIIKQSQQQQR